MRDYSTDKDEAKSFILNYEVNGDVIKVNLANGDNYEVPNTKENEEKLINKMEEQVEESGYFESKQEKSIRGTALSLAWGLSMFGLDTILLATGTAIWPVVIGICAAWFAFSSCCDIAKLVKVKRDLKDIKKNRLFLDNKKRINDYLGEENEPVQVLENQMDKGAPTKKEDTYTINNIECVAYDNLQKIVNDIDRDEELGISREKPKQKTLGSRPHN